MDVGGCGELPSTPCVITGGKGGRQYYFQHVSGLQNKVNFAPKLDIRNDGGYVVSAGSFVNSSYSFEAGAALGECPLAQMPEWLIHRITNASKFKQANSNTAIPTDGRRDHAVTQAKIESALPFIDCQDHDTWLMVGMALHHWAEAAPFGFDIWNSWSSSSLTNYDEAALLKRWASFNPAGNGGKPITILSVLKLAREHGWQGYRNGDGAAGPGETGGTFEWSEPQPIGGTLPAVLPMTRDMLPPAFRDFAADTAERMSVPFDIIGITLIIAASPLIGLRIGMRPKRHDNWTVYPTLWGAVVARPGVLKKSPSMKQAMSALYMLDSLEQGRCESAGFNAEVRTAKLKAMRDEINRLAKEKKYTELEELRENYDQLVEQGEPRRTIVNDTTVEKLTEIYKRNPSLLLFRDELMGWLLNLERDGREGDRPFYLECWESSGTYHVDRIARGSSAIGERFLSVLGSLQPDKLARYLNGNLAHANDGLISRFQLLVWPDVGEWKNIDREPLHEAREKVEKLFEKLWKFNPDDARADADPYDQERAVPALCAGRARVL